mgnify:CR=1 FL=1
MTYHMGPICIWIHGGSLLYVQGPLCSWFIVVKNPRWGHDWRLEWEKELGTLEHIWCVQLAILCDPWTSYVVDSFMNFVTLKLMKSVPMVGRRVEGIGLGSWFGLRKVSLSLYIYICVCQVLGSSMGVCGLGSCSLFHAMAQSLLMSIR